MKYKVLDVREYVNVNTSKKHVYVVIAEECETHKRKRFEFYKGCESPGLYGGIFHCGNSGDYALLIPGDVFKIEKEFKYDKVVLLNKEDVE